MARHCGTCTLCCRLVPVDELAKPGGQRCRHQRHSGCMVYETRPLSCRAWSCAWLADPTAGELSRPDRAGYAIDMMPDFIRLRDNETGAVREIPVVQVWLDPRSGDRWQDDLPLKRYLEARGKEGFAAIMRLSPTTGFVLYPPGMMGEGWVRSGQPQMASEAHAMDEVFRVLEKAGVEVLDEAAARRLLDRL